MSASTSATESPPETAADARFQAIVVLPSPLRDEVTSDAAHRLAAGRSAGSSAAFGTPRRPRAAGPRTARGASARGCAGPCVSTGASKAADDLLGAVQAAVGLLAQERQADAEHDAEEHAEDDRADRVADLLGGDEAGLDDRRAAGARQSTARGGSRCGCAAASPRRTKRWLVGQRSKLRTRGLPGCAGPARFGRACAMASALAAYTVASSAARSADVDLATTSTTSVSLLGRHGDVVLDVVGRRCRARCARSSRAVASATRREPTISTLLSARLSASGESGSSPTRDCRPGRSSGGRGASRWTRTCCGSAYANAAAAAPASSVTRTMIEEAAAQDREQRERSRGRSAQAVRG